ncbi:MAG: hypothetical protein HN778_06025 [Prolixibacteraceae bacterium]|jgi:hypothetical protein|nr:hypothetical protein [Prolixibacteraceae bacterium]MBT6007375.1 hypothetical protein [Prolixibacteraceae bacterium]MBT6767226.1 hypothetical protein [Prolixibacteraceae bacterium]MBT6999148.1 hypothetical protein [Prolixibacteraceae bacterium]MBT7394372.1 hypothetical protein [Prolixibacteraceae bacterium]
MSQYPQRIIPIVIKKIDDAHAIWFKNSKTFVLFEEPAFEVFRQYAKGIEIPSIKSICINKYAHLEKNIPQFVDEIIDRINFCNNLENEDLISTKYNIQTEEFSFRSFSKITYLMGEWLTISYGNKYLKQLIHPLFAAFEKEMKQDSENLIELFETNKHLIFKYKGSVTGVFKPGDLVFFKGAVLKLIYSIIYKRSFDYWMMTLHSSGVIRNNKAVLFSGSAGSGKSTLAALLQANGYEVLSDDFIAVGPDGCVNSFPAAISVKTSALNVLTKYYPDLLENPGENVFNRKGVRYLQIQNLSENRKASINVKAFVFVKFVTFNNLVLKELDKKKAIELLLKEAWVKPEPDNVSKFFGWIEHIRFYQLHYSESNQAIKFVEKLFLA